MNAMKAYEEVILGDLVGERFIINGPEGRRACTLDYIGHDILQILSEYKPGEARRTIKRVIKILLQVHKQGGDVAMGRLLAAANLANGHGEMEADKAILLMIELAFSRKVKGQCPVVRHE